MIPKIDDDLERAIKLNIPFDLRKQPNKLVKSNVWYDYLPDWISNIEKKYHRINFREIELVPFEDQHKPVVRHEQVFQICIYDSDGDCILKDDINGVEIIRNAFTGDEYYDLAIFEYLPNHPVNSILQIKYRGEILDGDTLLLQIIVDLFYSKFYYI